MNFQSPTAISAKVRHALRLDALSPGVRKILVGVIGGVVLLAGIIMIVFPGPAFVFVPLGLGILALEFAWAQRYLEKVRGWYDKACAGIRRRRWKSHTGDTHHSR